MSNSYMDFGGAPNVVGIRRNVHTGDEDRFLGKNIITNDGDQYYCYLGCGSAAFFTAAGLRVGSGTATPAKTDTSVGTVIVGGSVAASAGFPKYSDASADNGYGSADTVTWKYEFGTGAANGTVAEGAIVDSLTAPTKCICHFLFGTAFVKTSSDTLTVYVNHNFLGS